MSKVGDIENIKYVFFQHYFVILVILVQTTHKGQVYRNFHKITIEAE